MRSALPVALLAGISLHAGIFHLLIYAQTIEKRRADFYFGVGALIIASYDICCVGLYCSTSLAQGMSWQRLQLVFIVSAGVCFMYFIDAYAGVQKPRIARIIAWLFPLVGLVTLVERRGLMLTGVPAIKHIEVPILGPITYYESEMGPLYYIVSLSIFYIAGYWLWTAIIVRNQGDKPRARTIAWAILLFASGTLHDALISAGVFESIYLLEYSWTSIIVLAGYALSKDLAAGMRARQALVESQVRLANAERLESVGKLAGGVAHDLNNMLTPVVGFAQLARNALPAESRERTYLDYLVAGAERAAALTQQLLAFARKQVLEVRPIDLTEALRALEPLLRGLLPETITLSIEAEPHVPWVEADRGQLDQVWMNLASNARDAMTHGGTLTYHVTAASPPEPRGVVVKVADTGTGIPRAVADRIFEPFFSTKPRGEGTGLGLSIVHGIVEQHGGRIHVESGPDQGATFRLFFPASTRQPVPSPPPAVAAHAAFGDEQILVVDDEVAVLHFVVEVLKRSGYRVTSASSGSALHALLAQPDLRVDLVLTDVVLPDIDGPRVHALVSERFPMAACMYMTGHADNVLGARGLLRERVDLLRKPFSADELLERVQRCLSTAQRPERDSQ
jgi:signal transduction histidine kinase/ActR/RegA family two-component response regulator